MGASHKPQTRSTALTTINTHVFCGRHRALRRKQSPCDGWKYIRKHLPRVKGLITYASTGEHHEGTVYVADGWFEIQRTKGGGDWESRAGRKNRDMSGKIKFARSP